MQKKGDIMKILNQILFLLTTISVFNTNLAMDNNCGSKSTKNIKYFEKLPDEIILKIFHELLERCDRCDKGRNLLTLFQIDKRFRTIVSSQEICDIANMFDALPDNLIIKILYNLFETSNFGNFKTVKKNMANFLLINKKFREAFRISNINKFKTWFNCQVNPEQSVWTGLCLMEAVKTEDLELTKILIKKGTSINGPTHGTNNPINVAINPEKKPNLEFIKFLIKNGANVNSQGLFNNTILLSAIKDNNAHETFIDLVNFLLDNGADISIAALHGNTALHNAVCFAPSNLDLINILLFHGADINAKNANGKTPLMIAQDGNYKEILQIFMNIKL